MRCLFLMLSPMLMTMKSRVKTKKDKMWTGIYLMNFKCCIAFENDFHFCRFYLYKLPGRFDDVAGKKGCLYFFITSKTVSSQWTLSEYTLNDITSMAGQTLAQAYFDEQSKQDRLLIAYNDEPPNNKSNARKGHLKGVVVADKRSGFWLVHSVPLYPNISCKC